MSNDNVRSEFDNQKQRVGYCYGAWRNKKNKMLKELLLDAADKLDSLKEGSET